MRKTREKKRTPQKKQIIKLSTNITPLEQFKSKSEDHRNRDKIDNPSTDKHGR